ncbi:MAG: hypothetical protein AAFQ17_06515 [Pseudomonadota bacterium]
MVHRRVPLEPLDEGLCVTAAAFGSYCVANDRTVTPSQPERANRTVG